MSRAEVLRYLMKPVADLPLFMGNVDWGQYGGWAEGSMITTERVLVRARLCTLCAAVSASFRLSLLGARYARAARLQSIIIPASASASTCASYVPALYEWR